jgi:hypothetical protein
MLSEFEENTVWENMMGSEIRAAYFAALSVRYRKNQFRLILGSLVLSSGATLSLITSIVPTEYSWVKPVLTLVASILSAWSLLAKNERNSMDSADLHSRWSTLAIGYQHIWANVASDDARTRLKELQEQEVALSKSSTSFPDDEELMNSCQENVMMHRQKEPVAV